MKKLILVLMVLVYSMGYSQPWISLDLPELTGVTAGETVFIPVTATDIIMPHTLSSFYIYVEWEDAVLDYVDMVLSPEMIINIPTWNILFQKGNASVEGVETCVGGFLNTIVPNYSFTINPGDVFFIIEAIYQGDGTVGTNLNFQFTGKDVGGKLQKGVTTILDQSGAQYTLNYTTPAGGVNMDPGGGFVWDGGGDGVNWTDPLNWDPNGLPGDTDDVTVNDLPVKATAVVISGAATCATLTVGTGAEVEIDPTGSLTTNGLFTNDGDLTITSDALGYSGSYIDLGGMAGIGNYTFNRDIVTTAAYGAMGGWHYLSTPVTGFENWDMFDYFANGFDGNAQTFFPLEGTITPVGQPCIPAAQTVLGNMEAWSIKQDITYGTGTNFMGHPDDCYMTYPGTGMMIELAGPMANVNSGAFGPMAVFTGWNFYGNPYSSDIDPSMITFGPSTIQSIAMWDGVADNYYYSSAAVWANNIAPTQGFFVEATGVDNFSLAGTERVHSGAFWGKSDITNLLTLQATGNDKSDLLYVRFMEELTAEFDNNGDAHKLLSEVPGVPQIFTTVGSEMLAINALPAIDQVPMGFTSVESGSFSIEAIETSEFSEVYLQDLVTGEVTDLLATDYSFEYTAGENANRFVIHFAPVGINDINAGTVKIWALDNNIIVNVPVDVNGEIAVFNLMGQEVARTDIESVETQIPVSDVNTYYVVKVISDSNAVTGKVYVK